MFQQFKIYPKRRDTSEPHYRYFKILYTLALRLKFDASSLDHLDIQADLSPGDIETDRDRKSFRGSISIQGKKFENLIIICEPRERGLQLVTFWKQDQKPDGKGSKGGAHSFAELAIEALKGEIKAPTPKDIIELVADDYNTKPTFNVMTWILLWTKTLHHEPETPETPLAKPSTSVKDTIYPNELKLLNKWSTDVLRTGTPYVNYEVDACVKSVRWDTNSKIWAEIHFENGQYITAGDFGTNDRYASTEERKRVFNYLKSYENSDNPARLILTLKEGTENWTIASATMLKRLRHIIEG
jgi:hypothetical protein